MFEVDGLEEKIYCQNPLLPTSLWTTKTLYFDVDPSVLCSLKWRDDRGFHPVITTAKKSTVMSATTLHASSHLSISTKKVIRSIAFSPTSVEYMKRRSVRQKTLFDLSAYKSQRFADFAASV
jgi:hypothetical protein